MTDASERVTDDLAADEVREQVQRILTAVTRANVEDPEIVARVTSGLSAAMAQWLFSMIPVGNEDQLVEIVSKQVRSFLRQMAERNPEEARRRAPISADWRAVL